MNFNALDIELAEQDKIAKRLPSVYEGLIEVIDSYLDLDDANKRMLALWIMAAPYKEAFRTFPILYINASKGSGKTRAAGLINALIPEAICTPNISEAAFFRICAKKRCIIIDEAERLNSKEKATLKDLLNVCYKRSGKVLRTEKDKLGGFQIAEYEVYNPVVLANISGLDAVLEDRCITMIMQKTLKKDITRMLELFDLDPRITALRAFFENADIGVGLAIEEGLLNPYYEQMLNHRSINSNQPSNIKLHTTLTTPNYTNDEINSFINLVYMCYLNGRDFELWLPLFAIAFTISIQGQTYSDLFQDTLALASIQARLKEEEALEGDADTALAVSRYNLTINTDFPVTTTSDIIKAHQDTNGQQDWLNSKWVGRCLKRIGVIKKKCRLKQGYEYTINKESLRNYLQVRHALELIEQTGTLKEPQKQLKENQVLLQEAKDLFNDPKAKEGVLLGMNFENAPENIRPILSGMAKAGEIYQPKEGIWKLAKGTF
jgi:hypothetical protein